MRSLLLAALATLSLPAAAQAPAGSGFDAHGFRLAAHDADVRDPLVVVRPGRFGPQTWFVGGVVEYASQPLVFDVDDSTVIELDNLVAANISLGYAPHERIRLDLSTPLYFFAEGEDGPLGAGLGDIRATGLVALIAPTDDEGLGLALTVNGDLPTGRPEAYLGHFTVAGGFGIAGTVETGRSTFTATASSQLRPNTDPDERPAPTRGGDAFTWGVAAGYALTEQTGVNLEVHSEVPVDSDVRDALGIPAEALLSFRHVRESGGFLTAGLGTGLSRGAGSSPLRLLVGGGFGRTDDPNKDTDGDGIIDKEDACIEEPETVNGYDDADGCADVLPTLTVRVVDASGSVAEDAALEVKGPLEQDGQGQLVLEGPEVLPGTEWELSATRGACLAGSGSVTLAEGGSEVDVALQPVRDGVLRVEVVDAEGASVEGATVMLRASEPECGPLEMIPLDGGAGEVPLGPAQFQAFVQAPGYTIHSEGFTLAAGGSEHVIRAVLKPTKVELEADKIVILDKVYFETGKATLLEKSFDLLDEVASVIDANAIQRVEIEGHTDSQGSEKSNLELSQQRADAVRVYLIDKGIPEERLVAKGFGEAVPVADNGTPAGRAKNRRVEFVIPDDSGGEEPETPTPRLERPEGE